MANSDLAVRPAATSWGAVLGGWVATIGASVIFAPMVAGLLVVPGTPAGGDIAVAVPVVLGLFLSYIVGGYVAGRMAGYRTSWHGMMTAFFTLFVLLVLMVLGIAADNGLFAASGIRCGWLGGLLAPSHVVSVVAPARPVPVRTPTTISRTTERREATERPSRILPAFGRKGGDRVETDEVRTTREDRIQDRS
ncbi:MAG: hypothetical protein E6J35_03105 [Chloroflexi bacterium]|nr:MAG: hypothetical protein E6J35_03105 [Chloroflexota bacterium]